MGRKGSTYSDIQKRKNRIRRRDSRRFNKKGVCELCGPNLTEIHHYWYSDEYDEEAFIEVCNKCHIGIFHPEHAKKGEHKR